MSAARRSWPRSRAAASEHLDLAEGDAVTVLIKATEVMLGK
jgi:molybdopterin-binding protein